MLLTKDQINNRIDSPLNLMNQIQAKPGNSNGKQNESNVYGISIDRLIEDVESKLAVPAANATDKQNLDNRKAVGDKALAVTMKALNELDNRIDEVEKPRELSTIIRDLSQVVRNTTGDVDNSPKAQFIFHVPVTKKESDFEVIDVAV